jgi:hypothetical protein
MFMAIEVQNGTNWINRRIITIRERVDRMRFQLVKCIYHNSLGFSEPSKQAKKKRQQIFAKYQRW